MTSQVSDVSVVLSDDVSTLLNWNDTAVVALASATGQVKWQVTAPYITDVRPYISNSVLVIDRSGIDWSIQSYDLQSGTKYDGAVRINATVFGNYAFSQDPLLFDSNSNLIVCYST